MTELRQLIAALRRPKLMIQAARLGVADYRRERDLRRLLGPGTAFHIRPTLEALLEQEANAERQRTSGEAGYNLTRHLELLIALVAESRLLASQTKTPQAHEA